jgi:nucleoid DNA-binding protein
MYDAVKKFLALHHHLALPGIGNFSVKTSSAQIDFPNKIIAAPVGQIIFSNEQLPAEKNFYGFLSVELKIDEVQAIRRFTDFTAQLQSRLNEEKSVHLKGIGQLTRETSHVLNFQPEEMPAYFPAITAERVIRKNAMHLVKVGEQEKTSTEMQTALRHEEKIIRRERWWIPAAILAFIGIAALIFYYTTYR